MWLGAISSRGFRRKPFKSLRRILPVIRHQREKMDGSGYPDGLRGEAIPLKARILQIVDIYDALTTNRPYRGALPPEEALQTLFSEAQNGWLDASVVLKFSRICTDDEYFPVRGTTMLASYYALGSLAAAMLGGDRAAMSSTT